MIFPDLYEEMGITYRYQMADILTDFKGKLKQHYQTKEINEQQLLNYIINFMLLENNEWRIIYDWHYLNFFKVEDNVITYKLQEFSEAESKEFIQSIEKSKENLYTKALEYLNNGEKKIYADLKIRYRKMMMTTKNIVLFILATAVVILTLFLIIVEAIRQLKIGKFNHGLFQIYSYFLLFGFGVYCKIWYSVHF